MVVKKNFPGIAWKCECDKWNFPDATFCWKCKNPKEKLGRGRTERPSRVS